MYAIISTVSLWLKTVVRNERGQDLLEYALLGGLIAAAIIAVIALGTMTGAITNMAGAIGDCIDFDSATSCDPV
jgi:Flp pilus assembly pilin Flp